MVDSYVLAGCDHRARCTTAGPVRRSCADRCDVAFAYEKESRCGEGAAASVLYNYRPIPRSCLLAARAHATASQRWHTPN